MLLQAERSHRALETLALEARLQVEDVGASIVRVVNSNMERAIRVISVQRGHDVREFTLICFGGAGGLHAADLARSLGMQRVLVPLSPGTLCAYGVLNAHVIKDLSRTVLGLPSHNEQDFANALRGVLHELEAQGRKHLKAEGADISQVEVTRSMDMRYAGQSYEITVPFNTDSVERFHVLHERQFGHASRNAKIEIVTARVRLRVPTPPLPLTEIPVGPEESSSACVGAQHAWFGEWVQTPLYQRESLLARMRIPGPAIIVEQTSTTVVPPGCVVTVDRWGNLIMDTVTTEGMSTAKLPTEEFEQSSDALRGAA